MTKICDAYETTRDLPQFCKDCTNCVIKQVIEKCKENLSSLETYIDIRSYECTMLQDILDLFDIEEINK
jgi:hypothetical protein